jgi:hypothetical protein
MIAGGGYILLAYNFNSDQDEGMEDFPISAGNFGVSGGANLECTPQSLAFDSATAALLVNCADLNGNGGVEVIPLASLVSLDVTLQSADAGTVVVGN